MKQYTFIRFIEFPYLFELFSLSAILAILGIRLYLQLTGFPQIGSGPFHIAHITFGGFFMLLSILGFMTFLNNNLKSFWAVFGGIGFGTFIDELGKFITRDNNYFYQPTFVIIYIIFIGLYLFYKSVEHNEKFSKDEYLINTLNLVEDVIIKDLDKEEKTKALQYLRRSDQDNSLTLFLKKSFSEIGSVPDEQLSAYGRIRKTLRAWYDFYLSKPLFLHAVALFFIIRSFSFMVTGIYLIVAVVQDSLSGNLAISRPHELLPVVQFIALVFQAVLTILGALTIWKSRKNAYIFFRNALLVSIFVLQVFNFYNDPVQAFFSTLVDLLLLSILNYMIAQEDLTHTASLLAKTE